MDPASFRINYLRQVSILGAPGYDLPYTVTINTKKQLLAIY
jgi:hypothetical protein